MEKRIKKQVFFGIWIVLVVVLLLIAMNLDRIFPAPEIDLPEDMYVDEEFDVAGGNNPESKVSVIEFGDFSCGHCKDASETMGKLRDYYGDNVNFVFKHMTNSADSSRASAAAECARDQGMFWEYHDLLFENQYKFDLDELKKYAVKLDLEDGLFSECIESGDKSKIISEHRKEATSSGVRGTPTFIINGLKIEGDMGFLQMKSMIDKYIED